MAKSKKDRRREIIAKAMVEPAFGRKLFANPEEVFGGRLSETPW
jgi:hypothetical protein